LIFAHLEECKVILVQASIDLHEKKQDIIDDYCSDQEEGATTTCNNCAHATHVRYAMHKALFILEKFTKW